jgi:hypothetical protein
MFARSHEERSYYQPGSDLVDAGANDDGMAKTDTNERLSLTSRYGADEPGDRARIAAIPDIGLPRIHPRHPVAVALKHDAVQSGSE